MSSLPRKIALAAALAAAMGLPAMAQNTAGAATTQIAAVEPGARMQAMQERMQKRHAERLGQLKQELRITASQEAAWQAFADAMQAPKRAQGLDRDAMARLSTPERIDRMRSLRAERNAEMDRRGDATKALYAALSPEQQQRMDAFTARTQHKNGRGMGRKGEHGHHGYHGAHGMHGGGMMH